MSKEKLVAGVTLATILGTAVALYKTAEHAPELGKATLDGRVTALLNKFAAAKPLEADPNPLNLQPLPQLPAGESPLQTFPENDQMRP